MQACDWAGEEGILFMDTERRRFGTEIAKVLAAEKQKLIITHVDKLQITRL